MLQKRQPYQAINWSLVTLILAACGGGGGGGTPATRAVVLPSGVRQFEVPEGRTEPTSPLQPLTPAEQSRAATDLTVKSVTVTADGLGVRIIYSSPHGDFAADARLSGPDAAFFKFDTQSESGVVFRQAPDFERPLDIGRDNHYDFKVAVSMPSNVPYTSFYNNIPGFQVKVTDVTGPDDPTPPGGGPTVSGPSPPQATQPSLRMINVAEGQTLIPLAAMFTSTELNGSLTSDLRGVGITVGSSGLEGQLVFQNVNSGALTIVNFLVTGPDAGRVMVGRDSNLYFRYAPDFERPQDIGADNGYDLTLTFSSAGRQAMSTNFRVQVTDVTGDDDPTPPDQVLQGAEIL